MHDIKSFAIDTFLSSLLLKKQVMISNNNKKKLCERIPSPNEIAKQAGVLGTKSPGLIRQHLWVVSVSVVVVIAKDNAHHSAPSPKIGKIAVLFH